MLESENILKLDKIPSIWRISSSIIFFSFNLLIYDQPKSTTFQNRYRKRPLKIEYFNRVCLVRLGQNDNLFQYRDSSYQMHVSYVYIELKFATNVLNIVDFSHPYHIKPFSQHFEADSSLSLYSISFILAVAMLLRW